MVKRSMPLRGAGIRGLVWDRRIRLDISMLRWLVPVAAGAAVHFGYVRDYRASGLVLSVGIVLLAARRPAGALVALSGILPFSALLLAQLYALGLPAAIVRPLGAWKEALAVGVVMAGVRGFRASGHHLDRLDVLALAYLGFVVLYALLPQLFAPQAPVGQSTRLLAFRSSAGFVTLMVGARHAGFSSQLRARALRVAMIAATLVAAVAVYEFFFPSPWNHFVVQTVQYPRYQAEIVHSGVLDPTDVLFHGVVAGRAIVRVGSVFLNPLALGFYLVVGFAVAIERIIRQGARATAMGSLLLIGTALLLTQTRSALVAAIIVAVIALRPTPGQYSRQRVQLGLLLGAGLLIALPAASGTGLSERIAKTTPGEKVSAVHIDSFWRGMRTLADHPLGRGLATSAGAGQRFTPTQAVVSENYYLQVGDELGVPAMLVFVALTIAVVRALRRAARRSLDAAAAAVGNAAFGLAVGALFLHTWNDHALAWTLWGLAGASLAVDLPGPSSGTSHPSATMMEDPRGLT
jgi:hypothetical protein